MTRMHEQKQHALTRAVEALKELRHLTGNNADVTAVQEAAQALKAVL